MAAKEALTRDLSAELAPHGIRVVSLRPNGIPETSTMRELFEMVTGVPGGAWGQSMIDRAPGRHDAHRG